MKIELRAEPGASSQSEINPFAAPIVQDLAESPDAPLSAFQKPWNLHLAWALAVLFNLPIPVMFGTTVTDVGAPGTWNGFGRCDHLPRRYLVLQETSGCDVATDRGFGFHGN